MKDSKKEALAEFHRQNILSASEKLFLEKGITKTTMDDIAKTAQYSKATLYVYFKNKEEIINHLTFKSMQLLYSHIHEAIKQSDDLFIRYKTICYALVHYQEDYPLYYDIATSHINVDIENPDTPTIIKQIYMIGESINQEIACFIQQGIKNHIIKEDLPLLPTIFWFWASLTGIIKLASEKDAFISKSMGLTKKAFLDYSFKMLLQSILKEGVINAY